MRDLKFIIGVLALCLLVLFVVHSASAIETDVTPTLAPIFVGVSHVTQEEFINHTYTIHRIQQGDKVYLGDHIDISGVVAGNKALVWFRGGDPDPAEQPYVIPLPDTKAGYYDFYVDPAIFTQMTGDIWKWNGVFESNGNMHAFYIVARYRTNTLTYPNGTLIESNVTATGSYNVTPKTKEPILPVKHVADYLTVHSQSVTVTTNGKSKLWVLGRVDGIYDQVAHDNQSISDYQIKGLETGTYQLLIHYPSADGFEVFYNNETEQLYTHLADQPPWVVDNPVSLESLTPILAADKIKAAITSTNDTYDIQSLVIQEPSIQLVSMDQVSTGSAKEYYKNPNVRGNVTLFDVKGYTNVQPGTIMNFALDEREQTKVHWFNTTAEGNNPGDMRTFEVYIPVYWDDMKAGVMHTISGYTDIGGSIYRDFPVRESPDHSYIPEQTVKWIGDRNPWVPNVTVTVTVPVPGPTRIVTVTITPDQNQLNATALAQQRIVAAEQTAQNTSLAINALAGVGVVAVLFIGIRFVYRAQKRKRWVSK